MDLDFLLIHQIKSGDTQAAEKLIRKYYPEILRYCYLHISDHSYAEDLTQETFEHFFSALNRYQYRGKTKNYLYTIASNLCRDYHKKCKELPMEDLPEQPIELILKIDTKLDLHTALSLLHFDLREVTILYFFHNRTQKEIAAILGISQTLVQRRLDRAKSQLRFYLEEEADYETQK